MQYRALFFDFDYTLVDSGDAIAFCFNTALTRNGDPPLDENDIKALVGVPLADMYRKLCPDKDDGRRLSFVKHYRATADLHMTSRAPLYAGVAELLRYCRSRRIHTAIISAKMAKRVHGILERAGLISEVGLILGSTDVAHQKPSPEGVVRALDHFQLTADQVAYVGDHVIDGMVAKGAGVNFIAVRTGKTTDQAFADYQPVAILNTIAELKGLLSLPEMTARTTVL